MSGIIADNGGVPITVRVEMMTDIANDIIRAREVLETLQKVMPFENAPQFAFAAEALLQEMNAKKELAEKMQKMGLLPEGF